MHQLQDTDDRAHGDLALEHEHVLLPVMSEHVRQHFNEDTAGEGFAIPHVRSWRPSKHRLGHLSAHVSGGVDMRPDEQIFHVAGIIRVPQGRGETVQSCGLGCSFWPRSS